MISKGFLAWILFCSQVSCRPLSSELETEDEKVTRCIVEVISDTLSKPYPMPVSRKCSKILEEDERILAMVRHQNLLKELQDLTHHEETRESSAKKKSLESNKRWNDPEEESVEWNEEDNIEKKHLLDKKGGSTEWRDNVGSRGGDNAKTDIPLKREEDMKKYEDSEEENMKEQHEYKGINGQDDTKVPMRKSEELSEEDKRSPEKRQRDSSEEEDRISKKDEQEDRDVLKIGELIEKITREELEDEDDKKVDEKHHKEYSSEEGDFNKRNEEELRNVEKRVEENASDEETDQFEAEGKRIKIFDPNTHLHETDDKHSPEKTSQDDKRHHRLEEDMDLKRHDDDLEYLQKRHHDFEDQEEQKKEEEEEIEEEGQDEGEKEEERKLKYEEHKLKNLVEIEKELKKVAEKLRDIRRG